MTTVLGEGIDLLILSIFSTFVRGRAMTCLLGFSNVLSKSMTTLFTKLSINWFCRLFPLSRGWSPKW
ncbi:hypothetical protein Y032_0004g2116 [Ancylostoma ceylanicum]|uniref:Uncharacterized protein n=1 Tax=Ancylostoma ceylanicum TaxID=53326 RepID=A0A016VVC0_9BILA|nr:hypothetical protein Y032_0004g2116 [Ancylostoma ceylanicum]